jgi:hypothetical protein
MFPDLKFKEYLLGIQDTPSGFLYLTLVNVKLKRQMKKNEKNGGSNFQLLF